MLRNNQKGWTLIELLIVIAVLGILVAIAVPQVVQFIGKGRIAAANAELGVVNTAIQAGMADAGVGDILEGSVDSTGQTGGDEITIGGFLQGGYAKLQGSYAFDVDGFVTYAEFPKVDTFEDGQFK